METQSVSAQEGPGCGAGPNCGSGEQGLRAVLETIPAMYVVTTDSPSGPVIEDCNELFLTGLGYPRDQVIGRPLAELYSPASAARMRAGGYQRALDDDFEPEERQFVRRDGTLLETLLQTRPRHDCEGRAVGTHAAYIDITERERATRQARAAQQYTESLIRSSLDMIFSVDEQRRLVEFNPAAEASFGYQKSEIVGQNPAVLYAEPEEGKRVHARVLKDGEFSGDVVYRRRNGERFTCLLSASVLRDGDGRVFGVMGVARDITAQKRAEYDIRLQVSLQRLRNGILQMASERDWEGVATTFQEELRGFIEYTRWSINVVDKRTGSVALYFHDNAGILKRSVVDKTPCAIQRALDSGVHVYRRNQRDMLECADNPWFAEHGFQSMIDMPFSSGTVAISSLRRDAFTADDISVLGQFARVISEAQRRVEDIKALTYKEQQLRQAQKLEMIGQLGAGVAHEINNPLTVVLGQSELLLREPMAPEHREGIRQIHRSAERARVIAERLLLFARRQKAELQWVPLNPLVQETVEMMRYQFGVRSVELVEELAQDLPKVEIHTGQIQQVVLNLIQNSRDAIREHTNGGRIWVRTYQQRDWVVLEVEDDGPGIPPELEERIFEPFFTTKEPGVGTGLGLSVSHGIARDHGGHLYAKKREQGACVVLKLPVGQAKL